jgi:hypothetical protein
MSTENTLVVRIRMTPAELTDLRVAALWTGRRLSDLLADLARDYLNDKKRSPLVGRRSNQPPRRPRIKR